MKTIIINSNNLVPNGFNDTYRYNFPVGSVEFKDDQVAVSSVNMYYSWFNITSTNTGSRYGNNSLQYIWIDGNTFTITFPDGYYGVQELNAYFQSRMIVNGHYLVNDSGDFVYYLEFTENPTFYAIQFNSLAVPTALPLNWTNPAGIVFPLVASTPQIVILSTNTFRNIVGFNAGTYPAVVQSSAFSKVSDYTPQVSPVNSLILSCTLLNNRYAIPSTLLYSFSPAGTTFGDLISVQPPEMSFVDIQDGAYTDFTVEFRDQNLNRISINDSNLVILLSIKNKQEYSMK